MKDKKKENQDRFIAYGAIVGSKYKDEESKKRFKTQPYTANYNITQKARAHK